jgi:hypothetical protein
MQGLAAIYPVNPYHALSYGLNYVTVGIFRLARNANNSPTQSAQTSKVLSKPYVRRRNKHCRGTLMMPAGTTARKHLKFWRAILRFRGFSLLKGQNETLDPKL